MKRTGWTCCAALGALLPAVATAQPAPAARDEAQPSATTFDNAYFARFSPRNALDMLQQVPGFAIRETDEARGLGQASGNVLINGQRISGKTDDATTQLSRIAAANVVRIELLEGATLGIPGLSGQVANVVTRAGKATGRFEWKPEVRPHFTDPVLARGEVSVSGATGPLEYTVGLANGETFGGAGGPTLIRREDGSLIERRDERWDTHYYRPRATVNLTYHGKAGALGHLNLTANQMWYRYDEPGRREGPGLPDRLRDYRERQHGFNYEAGGDYAFALGPGRLKLIGLDRRESEPFYEQSLVSLAEGGADISGERYEQSGFTRERIARAEYAWPMLGGDWQLSGEAAFNRLSNRAALLDFDPVSGRYQPVAFPEGTGGVHESRYEAILSHSRKLAPGLTLQLTGGVEFSRLAQTGANAVVREFWRPKGTLNLVWKASPRLDLTLKAERKVGQLDFADFLARVFINEGNANAGNVALVPPQSWEFELIAKRDMDAWGSATLRLYDHEIEDLVDIVPIGADGQSPGNIDHARRRGLELTGTLELAPLGLRGAKVNAHVVLERSRVRDPLTGRSRPISETSNRLAEIEFRHDLPGTAWAYGADFTYEHVTPLYRLSEISHQFEGPNWLALYIENKDVFGLTVNARVNNLLNARSRLDRVVYTGFRDAAPIAFLEHRNRLIGPIFSLSIKGQF